jgi:hypothetical protein
MTSLTVSKPTETLTKPSVILTANLSSTDNLLCVVDAGCVTIVLVSPGESEHSFILSKNARPASNPPLFRKQLYYPQLSFVFGQFHIGMRFQKDISPYLPVGAALKLLT